MSKFVIYFFEVASWLTITLTLGSIFFLLLCIMDLVNKKKVLRNIIAFVVLLFCFSNGFKLFLSDKKEYEKVKNIENQIGSMLGVEITKSEVVGSKSVGDDYNMKLFGNKLPSGKTCELRTVRVKERYVGGIWGTRYDVEGLSPPTECESLVFLGIAPATPVKPINPEPKTIPAQSEVARKGELMFRTSGGSDDYSLYRLKSDQLSNLMGMLNTSVPQVTRRNGTTLLEPVGDAFKSVEIVTEQQSPLNIKTSLIINGATISKRSSNDEDAPFESVGELPGEKEVILVGTYGGGNSCSTQQQAIVVHARYGYEVSKDFGRCNPSIYRTKEDGFIYFVYSADEYNPMEVLALVKTPN